MAFRGLLMHNIKLLGLYLPYFTYLLSNLGFDLGCKNLQPIPEQCAD